MSLKLVPFESLGAVFLFAFYKGRRYVDLYSALDDK